MSILKISLNNIRIVLVETSHPGNIGAAARAMKTMGLRQLTLVNPCEHLCEEALVRATDAWEILQNASIETSLEDALVGCGIVYGTTARPRSLEWPGLMSHELPASLYQAFVAMQGMPIAIVFGRESSGLSNQELQQCHYQIAIPTAEDFHSLNLAQAVQVIAYECRRAFLEKSTEVSSPTVDNLHAPASVDKIHGLLGHWTETMQALGFFNPEQPKLLYQRLRRLIYRASLDETEINILRGFLAAVQKRIAR